VSNRNLVIDWGIEVSSEEGEIWLSGRQEKLTAGAIE